MYDIVRIRLLYVLNPPIIIVVVDKKLPKWPRPPSVKSQGSASEARQQKPLDYVESNQWRWLQHVASERLESLCRGEAAARDS